MKTQPGSTQEGKSGNASEKGSIKQLLCPFRTEEIFTRVARVARVRSPNHGNSQNYFAFLPAQNYSCHFIAASDKQAALIFGVCSWDIPV